jgi:Tol biopolymer transport system component
MAFTVSAASQGQTIGVIGVASTDDSGRVGHGGSSYQPALSADGRYVAFSSLATDLVAADVNAAPDVFWHDTCRGAPPGCAISTRLVSVDLSGHQLMNGARVNATLAPGNTITGDGRFVLFLAEVGDVLASHPGVPDFNIEVFVRDTCTGQPATCVPSTALVSQDALGNPANAETDSATISPDGRVVTFISSATNLVSEAVTHTQLYARETCLGATSGCAPANHLVSVSSTGDQANAGVRSAAVSAGGRYLVFESDSSNLAAGDHPVGDDVFERDTCLGAPPGCTPSTVLVSLPRTGVTAQSNVYAAYPSVSADGRFVVFESNASDLIAADIHGIPQVFLRDTCLGASGPCTPTTSLLSAALDGTPADSDSFLNGVAALSGDGRYAAFSSGGDNLLPGVTAPACYVRDTCAGTPAGCTPRLHVVSVDAQGNLLAGCEGNSLGGAGVPVLSSDGHVGVLERFDQASNGLQAYVVLTGF